MGGTTHTTGMGLGETEAGGRAPVEVTQGGEGNQESGVINCPRPPSMAKRGGNPGIWAPSTPNWEGTQVSGLPVPHTGREPGCPGSQCSHYPKLGGNPSIWAPSNPPSPPNWEGTQASIRTPSPPSTPNWEGTPASRLFLTLPALQTGREPGFPASQSPKPGEEPHFPTAPSPPSSPSPKPDLCGRPPRRR